MDDCQLHRRGCPLAPIGRSIYCEPNCPFSERIAYERQRVLAVLEQDQALRLAQIQGRLGSLILPQRRLGLHLRTLVGMGLAVRSGTRSEPRYALVGDDQ